MSDYIMVEAVAKHSDAKAIFKAFCDDICALQVRISPKNDEEDAIVCGFRNEIDREIVVDKMERNFPGKLSWR